jgi:hypothetical protein
MAKGLPVIGISFTVLRATGVPGPPQSFSSKVNAGPVIAMILNKLLHPTIRN